MESAPFFTVIMPIYKTEAYLSAAVESVLRQSFTDFELILVDDCSPDGSGAICDAYADKDVRVRVIHLPQNGGLSNARNTGIDAAQGQYITFVDSDDTVSDDLLALGYSVLQQHPADAVAYGMREEYFNADGVCAKTYLLSYGETLWLSTQEQVRNAVIHLEEKTLYGYVCNKFFKLATVRKSGARFETIPLIEDVLFNISFFENAASLHILDKTPYCYKKRIDGSLTNRYVPDYFKLHYRRVHEIAEQYKRWGLYNESVMRILAGIFARYIFSGIQRNCDKRAGMTHADRSEFLSKLFADPLFSELLPYMPGGFSLIGILSVFLKMRSKPLCLLCGRVIYIVKTKMPILFAKAKQSR